MVKDYVGNILGINSKKNEIPKSGSEFFDRRRSFFFPGKKVKGGRNRVAGVRWRNKKQ
ncbi:hypothetical protein HPP92_027656, partial [Vanilla planifolia]